MIKINYDKIFGLKNKDKNNVETKILNQINDTIPAELTFDNFRKEIKLNGKQYQIVFGRSSVLDFIFEDLPMFGFTYNEFETNIKHYFNSLHKN